MAKEIKLSLKGLDYANCANKIEIKVNELEEVKEANLNFSLSRMALSMSDGINKEIVVFSAVAVALIPPILIADAVFSTWLYRALSFLVVSSPCALVVSVPLGLFSGIGGASKKGILVKGGNYIEALKNVNTVVFDKTGTLTKGTFKVAEINAINISKEELLKVAAIGESFSNHPIAKSIVTEYNQKIDKEEVENYKEL